MRHTCDLAAGRVGWRLAHRGAVGYMDGNQPLREARRQKQDEFYTQLVDIENELRFYKARFAGKVVYCNCDDPYESNFFKFFAANFNAWGLKKLVATCYSGSPVSGERGRKDRRRQLSGALPGLQQTEIQRMTHPPPVTHASFPAR